MPSFLKQTKGFVLGLRRAGINERSDGQSLNRMAVPSTMMVLLENRIQNWE